MRPPLPMMALGSLALLACSVFVFFYVLLTQPSQEPPRHGLRGLKRARARAAGGGFNELEPVMLWAAARVAPFVSRKRRADLEQSIMLAGEVWGLAPEEMVALTMLGGVLGLSLGTLYAASSEAGVMVALLFGAFGLMLPEVHLSTVGNARVHGIQRRIPHIVDLLVLSLGAGLDFTAALRQVVERATDPDSDTIEELGVVLEELKLGRTRRQALAQFAGRVPCDEVRDLVAAAIQSEEQGTPLGVVLATQASTSRQRRSTRAEEAASKASTAMVLPIMMLFIALMILIVAPLALEALNTQWKG
jgi:tight adherence protein C